MLLEGKRGMMNSSIPQSFKNELWLNPNIWFFQKNCDLSKTTPQIYNHPACEPNSVTAAHSERSFPHSFQKPPTWTQTRSGGCFSPTFLNNYYHQPCSPELTASIVPFLANLNYKNPLIFPDVTQKMPQSCSLQYLHTCSSLLLRLLMEIQSIIQ